MSKIMAVVVLSALLAAPAVAFGAQSHHAYAQAPHSSGEDSSDTHMSAERIKALNECTAREQQFNQVTWGDQQIAIYRECMAERHQPE